MDKISWTGGARFGLIHASWPLATLSATSTQLTMRCLLLGTYTFTPGDIVRLEVKGKLPLATHSITIQHSIASYPQDITFFCVTNPQTILREIHRLGFVPSGHYPHHGIDRGFAVRLEVAAAVILLWNLLFFMDFFTRKTFPGPFSFSAFLLVFVLSTSIWKSNVVRKLIMNKGHDPGEIRPFLYLLAFITGVIALVMGLILLKGHA